MASGDALGQAMLDFHHGGLRGDCLYRDGPEVASAHIAENYFHPMDDLDDDVREALAALQGSVLDVGCGIGQYATWLEERGRDVVGIDASLGAVETARERGVGDVRVMDMFALEFPRDAFDAALVNGTQLGLAGSPAGVSAFLGDLARVTDEDGVAVVDGYDPTHLTPENCFGYRPDPREGVCQRVFHVEYERDGERIVGRTLHFCYLSRARLRETLIGTPWELGTCWERDAYYRVKLEKA
ncbi:bifunctional 2-polyprenyl-6-hydroxyphenol methylase/3-demethylubiquinol 3-O-methyltransferase UbiG [Haladaptatus sp. DYSN1]|uniref:class I SAM-dependent methyltransferase n=1 Tax=unclassified Haladaptatus TaxID=2622732 RepID=UPI0024049614|nr:class I SAM-dependent methyltransferase [Haladaptatus sp. DYSN1]